MSSLAIVFGFAAMVFLPCAFALFASRSRENDDGSDYGDRLVVNAMNGRVAQAVSDYEAHTEQKIAAQDSPVEPIHFVEVSGAVTTAPELPDLGALSNLPAPPKWPAMTRKARVERAEMEALRARAAAIRAHADALAAMAEAAAVKAEVAAEEAEEAEHAFAETRRAA